MVANGTTGRREAAFSQRSEWAAAFSLDDIAAFPPPETGSLRRRLTDGALVRAWSAPGGAKMLLPLSITWRWPAGVPAVEAAGWLQQEFRLYREMLPRRSICALAWHGPTDPALMDATFDSWWHSAAGSTPVLRSLHLLPDREPAAIPELPGAFDELHLLVPEIPETKREASLRQAWIQALSGRYSRLAIEVTVADLSVKLALLTQTLAGALAFGPSRVTLRVRQGQGPTVDGAQQSLALSAQQFLEDSGYVHLAAGTFVQPDDPLLRRVRLGQLFLSLAGNWEGREADYITLGPGGGALISGVRSISHTSLSRYAALLQQGKLPYAATCKMAADAHLRRTVAHQILTQGNLDLESVDFAYFIQFERYFEAELAGLTSWQHAVSFDPDHRTLQLTTSGQLLAADVARVFLPTVNGK